MYTVIFFTPKIATTVSSVWPAKLTQFQVITTTWDVKRQKKLKKAKKGQKKFKAKTKAGYEKNSNFHIFLSFLRLIGSEHLSVTVILVSKDLKAKKAASMPHHRKYVKLRLKRSKFGFLTSPNCLPSERPQPP